MNRRTLRDALIPAIRSRIPEITEEALKVVRAEVEEEDDELLTLTWGIIEDAVRTLGPDAVDDLLDRLSVALAGNGKGLVTLSTDLTAAQLTALTNAYQSAEKASRQKAASWTVRIARVFANFGNVLGRAAQIALTQ